MIAITRLTKVSWIILNTWIILKASLEGNPLGELHSSSLDCLFDMWNSNGRYDQKNSIDDISETDISNETIFLLCVFLAASFHQTTCINGLKHYYTVIETCIHLWNTSIVRDISCWGAISFITVTVPAHQWRTDSSVITLFFQIIRRNITSCIYSQFY